MSRSDRKNNRMVFEELEPRLLFSADGAEALAADAVEQTIEEPPIIIIDQGTPEQADQTVEENPASEVVAEPLSDTNDQEPHDENSSAAPTSDDEQPDTTIAEAEPEVLPVEQTTDEPQVTQSTVEAEESVTTTELVLIDSDVSDSDILINEINKNDSSGRSLHVISLDSDGDAVDQITGLLEDYQNLDAIHLITNGSDGRLDFGKTALDRSSLEQNSDKVSSWGDALKEDGDILLYGSSIGNSDEGESFLTPCRS